MVRWLFSIADELSMLRDLPPLLFRLVLAYGFFQPAYAKLQNLAGFKAFLIELEIPWPAFNAYLATMTEALGCLLLFIGLCTRLWTLPLMVLMGVAIVKVHSAHGFSAKHGGFEIPVYYLVMLASLFATGPGRMSVDYWIGRRLFDKEVRG